MSSSSFDLQLRKALAINLTPADSTRLDTAVAERVARRPRGAARSSRVGLALVALLIAAPLIYVTSAGRPSTETPFGVTDAAGSQAEIDAAKRVVPLPAGESWPWYVDVPDPNGGYSRGGGRSQVEGVAFCLWLGSWLRAGDAGDATALGVARSTLLAVPTWELYRSAFADQSYRDVLDTIVAGVERNDPLPGRAFFDPNCTAPPAPPAK